MAVEKGGDTCCGGGERRLVACCRERTVIVDAPHLVGATPSSFPFVLSINLAILVRLAEEIIVLVVESAMPCVLDGVMLSG